MQHRWMLVRLGRICERCSCVQATAQFDDDAECSGKRPGDASRPGAQEPAGDGTSRAASADD